MKRDIKFRAWNKIQNRWEEKLCLYLDDSKIGDVSECFHNEKSEDDYILCQYIGLKDKNGTDIYEGDIIRLFGDLDENYTVVYDVYRDAMQPAFILESDDGYGAWFSNDDREIIGNIHEGIIKNEKIKRKEIK